MPKGESKDGKVGAANEKMMKKGAKRFGRMSPSKTRKVKSY